MKKITKIRWSTNEIKILGDTVRRAPIGQLVSTYNRKANAAGYPDRTDHAILAKLYDLAKKLDKHRFFDAAHIYRKSASSLQALMKEERERATLPDDVNAALDGMVD